MPTDSLVFLHGHRTPACTATVNKHFQGYHTLQLMAAGSLELCFDDTCRILTGSWFWPCYPGPHIRFHRAPGCPAWDHRYVAFTGPLVERWRADGLLLTAPQPMPDNAPYSRLFDQLYLLMGRPDPLGQLRAVNLLEQMLLLLAEARTPTRSQPPWLQQVLDQLDDGSQVDYERLAGQLAMAPSTLRRRFRAATGMSLHRYALEQRIAIARHQLVHSDATLEQLADQLGYRDVYFFSRQFRQFVGMPPGQYRRTRQV